MIKQDHVATLATGQPPLSGTQETEVQSSERSLDEIVAAEQAEIAAQETLAAQQAKDATDKEAKASKSEDTKDDAEDAVSKLEAADAKPGADEVADPEEGDGDATEDEYKPNTKYKVLDQEHEFDPKLAAILDKDTEPLIRELYQKAHGLDSIKEKLQSTRAERDQYGQGYQQLNSEVGRIMGYKKSGDLDSFFEALQMSPVEVAKWVMEKAEIENLPPEQKAVYTERELLRRRMNALEANFQSVSGQHEQQAVQTRIAELSGALQKPEHVDLVKSFDSRNGAGAFQKAVTDHAAAQFHATQKDLSVPEAITSFMKMYGIEAPKPAAKPAAVATDRVVAKPKAKTIPNIGRSQASVTAEKKPSSIEDLRKLAKGLSL